jgi:hypothetical protein
LENAATIANPAAATYPELGFAAIIRVQFGPGEWLAARIQSIK